jgi:hypothetical protein
MGFLKTVDLNQNARADSPQGKLASRQLTFFPQLKMI